jgi:AcrR family transcriptional regulator
MTSTGRASKSSRNSYDDLVEVAIDLFSKHGYEGTTVRMIAEALGVKSGSLYSHISTKEEILKQIALSVADTLVDGAQAAASSNGTAEERLRALCRNHVEVVHRRQAAVTVYYDQWRKLDRKSRQEITAKRRSYEQEFVRVIADGIAAGTFEPVDPRLAALPILATCHWTYQWYNRRGSLKWSDIADTYVELSLNGLLRR